MFKLFPQKVKSRKIWFSELLHKGSQQSIYKLWLLKRRVMRRVVFLRLEHKEYMEQNVRQEINLKRKSPHIIQERGSSAHSNAW